MQCAICWLDLIEAKGREVAEALAVLSKKSH
jgi:hypothetical protein